jgi:hypothetical protein
VVLLEEIAVICTYDSVNEDLATNIPEALVPEREEWYAPAL